MLKIRLTRFGRSNQPKYRVVIAEKLAPVKGKFIEVLGHYHPASNPKVFVCDQEKIKYWISKGAQPSDTVASLLKRLGKMDNMDKYIQPRNKQKKSKKAVEAPATPKKAEATEAPKA